ncbi:hypothetical protein K2173_011401 [Erythroxylum novogranatense]|uniref:Protein LNK1 n=1 Tax=Erythroxylum novogranatense TaxID=1862640 RepID=A0AAV8S6B8_9ROSI|nr:hypothetical protein K2173_011401 [Erythroxylum novogranatense]
MSDLCVYELEDNVWDEFSGTDDHIVPHPGNGLGQVVVQVESRKKPRHEVVDVVNRSHDGIKCSNSSSTVTQKDKMLEKSSWSETPDGVFTASYDSSPVKERNIVSEETKTSNHCLKSENDDTMDNELFADDPILSEKSTALDNSSYDYPLNHISQAKDDLNFFGNGCEDKEGSDLLYYGWADDIGNFEDVDRMFRSCDATFGLEGLTNEDAMCWFPTSQCNEGSEDEIKMSSKFSTSETGALIGDSEQPLASARNSSLNDSETKSLVTSDKTNSRIATAVDQSAPSPVLFFNGSDAKSVSWQKKQAKHQNQSAVKRKDRKMENGCFFHQNGTMNLDMKHLFGGSSHQPLSTPGSQQHNHTLGPQSLNYTQMPVPYVDMDYSHSTDQISVCPTQSDAKSGNSTHLSASLKESLYASNQVESVKSFYNSKLENSVRTFNDNTDKELLQQELQLSFPSNTKETDITGQSALHGSVTLKKQAGSSAYDFEGHSEIEGFSAGLQGEIDSSNAQESSCVSSVFDDISLEATSFRQLQLVMERLDIRTKLCIRDSLYRLARSAEQRHNCANANGGNSDGRQTSSSAAAEEPDKPVGFMDVETNTNPIDRSIAHLLFHRPSDPSLVSNSDALSLKSQAVVRGSAASSALITKGEVCLDENANDDDKFALVTLDNR